MTPPVGLKLYAARRQLSAGSTSTPPAFKETGFNKHTRRADDEVKLLDDGDLVVAVTPLVVLVLEEQHMFGVEVGRSFWSSFNFLRS